MFGSLSHQALPGATGAMLSVRLSAMWACMWALRGTGRSTQAPEAFWQAEILSLKKTMSVNLRKIHPSTKWSKTGSGTVHVSSMCHLHSSREVRLLTCNENNCPMFNAYFYSSCLKFSWHTNGWKQRHRTLVSWGILQWEHMLRLQLDSGFPLIGITTISWQTLSYEHPRDRCWFLFILEPFSEQQAVEIGSSCSVKVMLVG